LKVDALIFEGYLEARIAFDCRCCFHDDGANIKTII